MFNNVTTAITKEFILERVSEEDIFKKYLGIEPSISGSYTNPLRPNDESPGCGFYVDNRGVWKFKDHAAGFNWDCFNVVEYDYGISFKEALFKIAVDFNLIAGEHSKRVFTKVAKAKVTTDLRIQRREWTKKDYAIWAEYYIEPSRLAFFNVYPVQNAWFLTSGVLRLVYGFKLSDPCFAYHFGGYDYKLYFPLREKGKKHIHTKSTIIQGYNQLPKFGDNLLITKSFKDVMCIDNFSNEFGLYSVAPMSETVVVSQEAFADLYNRFDNIATLFDFDRAGIKLTRKYEAAYKLPYYFFAKEFRGGTFVKHPIKDFSDYLKLNGIDNTKRLIERFIKQKDHGVEPAF